LPNVPGSGNTVRGYITATAVCPDAVAVKNPQSKLIGVILGLVVAAIEVSFAVQCCT
jgi:hypothetical protein